MQSESGGQHRRLFGVFFSYAMSSRPSLFRWFYQKRKLHLTTKHRRPQLVFTKQHEELRKTVKKIIDKDINPNLDKWEKVRDYPIKDVYRRLGNAGLLGITRETEYGGLGLDFSYNITFLEALKDINGMGIPFSIVATHLSLAGLAEFGSSELKREFMSPTLYGDRIACAGISEAGSASNVMGITTKATRKGDDLVINGGKMWITNGPRADWMCLLANTNEDNPHKNKSLICLPLDLPGISCVKIPTLGAHTSFTGQFYFDNVKVPAMNIIGEEGMGFKYIMVAFEYERLVSSIYITSVLERIIEITTDYCRQRMMEAKRLIDHEIVHFTLAELQTEVEALRSLAYRIATMKMNGEDHSLLVSMAKLKCGRLARQVTDRCLQYWGGMGISEETLMSRFFRDGRAVSIAGGADEIMLHIIAKKMGAHS